MPYEKLTDLPDSVRDNLPKHAQEIYKEAFNNAYDQYKDPAERRGDAQPDRLDGLLLEERVEHLESKGGD
jgi:cation transport regulator